MAVGLIDVTVARLGHPDPMIRERAARAIAELLLEEDLSASTVAALSDWTHRCKLESLAALAWLPFVRAGESPTARKLPPALPGPDSLLYALGRNAATGEPLPTTFLDLHSGRPPASFSASASFERNLPGAIPQIFSETVNEVEERALVACRRQWAFEFERVISRFEDRPSLSALWDRGRSEDNHRPVWNPLICEAYRSSLLRALAWAADSGRVPTEWLWDRVAMFFPVDLALWKLAPGQRPRWWPRVDESADSELDTRVAKVIRTVTDRLTSVEGDRLLAAGGYLGGDWDEGYELDLRGYFQRTIGPARPTSEMLFAHASSYAVVTRPQRLHFEGYVIPFSPAQFVKDLEDWEVCPATGHSSRFANNLWQIWRMWRGIHFPQPFLGDGPFNWAASKNELVTRANGTVIGVWTDWTDSISLELVGELPPNSGWVLTEGPDTIRKFEEATGSRFRIAGRVRRFYREHSYDTHKSSDFYFDTGR